jgi:quercetin dioxygenase-like cupin family protein
LHHHKLATEITLVLSGKVRMLNRDWVANDIIVIAPGTSTSFEVLEDAVTVVVKVPGAKKDKYLG